jgi:hypothetical protein
MSNLLNLLLSNEPIVIFLRYMDGELVDVLAGWRALDQGANSGNRDAAFDRLFVDIVQGFVGDYQGALLGPLKHVGFLHLAREQEGV